MENVSKDKNGVYHIDINVEYDEKIHVDYKMPEHVFELW